MKVVIDRFEGDIAFLRPIIQLAGEEVEYPVPVEYLPSGHGTGDLMELAFLPDPARRDDLRRNIRELLDSVPKK